MRYIILLTFILSINLGTSQPEIINFSIEIKDTILIKRKKDETIKVNVSFIRRINDSLTINIFGFRKYLHSAPFLIDSLSFINFEKSKSGLIYCIENTSGIIQPAKFPPFISFKKIKDEIKYMNSYYAVNEKRLKIKRKHLKDKDAVSCLQKNIEIENNKNELNLYVFPLLDIYHDLPKGEYYLYLLYAFNNYNYNYNEIDFKPSQNLWGKNKPFSHDNSTGFIESNKVKFVIE